MKNRVRMIVVLVCVFVVLPVVGGLVHLSRTSAQDAARYYAEAIAQRDQYIAQLQQENAYLRAELESAQRRLEMFGAQLS